MDVVVFVTSFIFIYLYGLPVNFSPCCPPHPPPLFCSRTTSSLYTVPVCAYCVDIMRKRVRSVNFSSSLTSSSLYTVPACAYCVEIIWKRVRSVNFAYCVEDRSLYTVPACAYCVEDRSSVVKSQYDHRQYVYGRFCPQQIIVLLVKVSSCNYTPSACLK